MTAATIRALIDLSGKSYVAYREMRSRHQQAYPVTAALEICPNGHTSRGCGSTRKSGPTAPMRDAISALVNLGYRHNQAELVIMHAALAAGDRASNAELVKMGLKALVS